MKEDGRKGKSIFCKETTGMLVSRNNREKVYDIKHTVKYMPSWNGAYNHYTGEIELAFVCGSHDYSMPVKMFVKGAVCAQNIGKKSVVWVPAHLNGSMPKALLDASKKGYLSVVKTRGSIDGALEGFFDSSMAEIDDSFNYLDTKYNESEYGGGPKKSGKYTTGSIRMKEKNRVVSKNSHD